MATSGAQGGGDDPDAHGERSADSALQDTHGDRPGSGHDHAGSLGHRHQEGLRDRVRRLFAAHDHDHAAGVDDVLESSRVGLRALWVSLALLTLTAALQAAVVVPTGSVALLGDTLHNVTDALTALPLAVAFMVGRRPATRRYTYGYGRAEDLAGILIVVFIAASAVFAGYAAVRRLQNPREVDHLWAVAVAGVVGFVGNEVVAQYRIRVGRQIGSAALVADGMHARTDGLTSLAVLAGAGGVAAGWESADPIVALVIVVAILSVLRTAAREVYRRLMDAVDPALVSSAEQVLAGTPGVVRVGDVRLRWIGHRLRAECCVDVDPELSIVEAHRVTEDCEHRLVHALGKVSGATVHADPAADGHLDHHARLRHHRKDLAGLPREDAGTGPTTTTGAP